MKSRTRTSWATRIATPVLLPKNFQSLSMAIWRTGYHKKEVDKILFMFYDLIIDHDFGGRHVKHNDFTQISGCHSQGNPGAAPSQERTKNDRCRKRRGSVLHSGKTPRVI